MFRAAEQQIQHQNKEQKHHTTGHSLALQDTPAAVGVFNGDAGLTVGFQVAGLHRDPGHLQGEEQRL